MSALDSSPNASAVATPPAASPNPQPPPISAQALQALIDQAGNFNLFSVPDTSGPRPAIRNGRSLVGIHVAENLHRFQIDSLPASASAPIVSSNRVGELLGHFSHRWMFMPDGYAATPGRVPPPTPFEPNRSQRFVMLDSVCKFGNGRDGFRGFGTGTTHPVQVKGEWQLQVTAIGTVLEGFGAFAGHGEGTYLYCGTLSAEAGFTGNIMLRIMDEQRSLQSSSPLPSLVPQPGPEKGVTYAIFRGEAVPEDPVTPYIVDGRQIGVIVVQGLRLLHVDCSLQGGGVTSQFRVGELIGKITAYVMFNPAAAAGTLLDPIPFSNKDDLIFTDSKGNTIGTFTAASSEGRVFNLLVGGQPCIRFGGTGPIFEGTGPFKGIQGMMTDNSVVAFQPHVSASVYVLRLNDPEGRFRAAYVPSGDSGIGAVSGDFPYAAHYKDVLGSKMHYIEAGSGDPILLLHGNPTWSYVWRNIIPHLAPLGRCIAPDLIGFGRSAKPGIGYTWAEHAPFIDAFIASMGLRNITLVLHDQGSSFGFNYAMNHPDNIKALAFFEAIIRPFTWNNFSTPEFRKLFQAFRSGGVGGLGWQMIVHQNMFIEQLLPQASGRPLSEQEMNFYREPFVDPLDRLPVWQFPRQTAISGDPEHVWDVVSAYSKWLTKTELPKLLLYAKPGALITEEHVVWSKKNMKQLQTFFLGEGSHFLQETHPHEIGVQIAKFIAQLN